MTPSAYVIGDLLLGQIPMGDAYARDLEVLLSNIAAESATLFINGNLFDFTSVAPLEVPEVPSFVLWDEQASLVKLEQIFRAQGRVLDALRSFTNAGGLLRVLVGDRDLDLWWPALRARLVQRLGPDCEVLYGQARFGDVLIEPGFRLAAESRPRQDDAPLVTWQGRDYLERVWTTEFRLRVLNELVREHPWFNDSIGPLGELFTLGLKERLPWIRPAHVVDLLGFLRRCNLRDAQRSVSDGNLLGAECGSRNAEVAATVPSTAFRDMDEGCSLSSLHGPALAAAVESRLQEPAFSKEFMRAANFASENAPTQGSSPDLLGPDESNGLLGLLDHARQIVSASRNYIAGCRYSVFGYTRTPMAGGVTGSVFNPGGFCAYLDLTQASARQRVHAVGLASVIRDPSLRRTRAKAVRITGEVGGRALSLLELG